MFKKMLLASTAGFIVVAGALYAGVAWSQESRFVFRYSAGVLPVAATGGGNETEGPGGSDGETGETDPGDGGTDPGGEDGEDDGDPDDGEPTDPKIPDEGAPVNGITYTATIELQDSNGNGFGDVGERLHQRATIRNVSDTIAEAVRIDRRISLGAWSDSGYSGSTVLAPGESFEYSGMVAHLTATMLADLASGLEFEAYVSLTAIGSETFPFEAHAKAATVVPFGTYEPVQPSEIVVSSPIAAHLDMDGDGYGDRGEVVRVSFAARNNGGLPAQGVSFEMSFPGWPAATGYCDRASLPASGSMSCSADIEISRDDLEGFGEPETVVSLSGSLSLVALNGDYYTAGEHSTALGAISFRVPPVEYAPHLRVVASEGWEFQCVTPWDAAFVADNQGMFLTRWDTSSRTVIAAGGNTSPGKSFSLTGTWFLAYSVDVSTMKAGAGKISIMKSGDKRAAIPSSMPQPCGSNGRFTIVSHGDTTTAYPVVFESVEVVNLPL